MLGFPFGHKSPENREPDPIDDEANSVLEHPELPEIELNIAKEIKSLEKQKEDARGNRALQERIGLQINRMESQLRRLENERIRNKNSTIL